MRSAPWLHAIDNIAAEAALVKGSSALDSAGHVVGLNRLLCQRRSLYPYFDRVESEANPVDKVSRGVAEGPWRDVVRGHFQVRELEELARSCGGWRVE